MPIGIASREEAKAKDFCERFNLKSSFGNYAEAIDSDFSTIVIGVPPKYHFELGNQVLRAEKNLIIEKPVVNSFEELKQLWPKLNGSKKAVLVAENHHFDPFHQKIKACLKENDFGRPLFLDLIRLGRPKMKDWRSEGAEMSLGALHEGGVHWIRRLLDFANVYETNPYDSVLGVSAHTPSFSLLNKPFEDTMSVTARHASGLVSRLFHSWGMPRRCGLAEMSKMQLEKATVYFDPRGLGGFIKGKRGKIIFPPLYDFGGFKTMWKDFVAVLEGEKKPTLSLKDIFLDFAYMDAAYRSAQSHQEERLEKIQTL